MIITAIKCDQCGFVSQVAEVPEAWATLGAIVRIRGTPHGSSPKAQDFKKRRDKLAQIIGTTHICPDCVERITTGKVSLKLTEATTHKKEGST